MLTWQGGGGWSVDGSVRLPGWDRQGLERLVRYCARPPFSQQRLGRLDSETLIYRLRKPLPDGRTELVLYPLQLLDRLAHLVTPPRIHKHRYYGVLAPRAKLRRAVVQSAGPAGATLQLLQQAERRMTLPWPPRAPTPPAASGPPPPIAGPCYWPGSTSVCPFAAPAAAGR